MKIIPVLILTTGLVLGQLLKWPQGSGGGVTLLDLSIVILDILGLITLKFKLTTPPLWIKAALVFTLIATFSLIFTPLSLSFANYGISFAYTLRFMSYILFGWLVYSGAFNQFPKKIPQIIISSGVILANLGLVQLLFLPNLGFLADSGWDPHVLRTVSTFLDPNFLGAYLILSLILLIRPVSKIYQPKFIFLFFILIYLALITTFSRSAAVMLLVSFLTLSYLNKSVKLLILTLILSFGFYLGFRLYHQQIAQPKNIDRQQSAQYRLDTWQQGLEMFKQSPIIGIGFNSYRYALREYQLTPESFTHSRGSSTNDSSLLFVAATTGTIGLIAYLSLLLTWVITGWNSYQHHGKNGTILLAGLAGLIINSFFINSLFYPWLLVWLILLSNITLLETRSK